MPLWFGLVTYGTRAFTEAVDKAIATAREFADAVAARLGFTLLLQPELSVVLFTANGWTREQYLEWSQRRAREGSWLVVPTTWRGEPCLRVCLVHPATTIESLAAILDDLTTYQHAS